MWSHKQQQRGAVSLFIVIFTALLITVVTASFVQIMIRGQDQATGNDLSQSAYDSAMAGVEDARRALVRLSNCKNSVPMNASCISQIENAFASDQTCDDESLADAVGVVFVDGEVPVGDQELNQAYTCVKVSMNTNSVEGEIVSETDPKVVPLRGVADFNQITVQWYTQEDVGEGQAPFEGGNPIFYPSLPEEPAWLRTRPALLRTQFTHFNEGSVNISTIENNARTLFLWPNQPALGGTNNADFSDDDPTDNNTKNILENIRCSDGFASTGGYLCSATLDLDTTITDDEEAYLQLGAFYNATHYKICLRTCENPIAFDGVQPIVDSTGRAGDLFRRVEARVSVSDFGSQITFPNAALYVGNDLCKDFFVTNRTNGYDPDDSTDGVCDPSVNSAATGP